ncbi:MAG: ribose-phosphate pyrophosphokinase [Clostridia bacterium]|nr:ribose-phosphate pyrophosphokinase [Clostridia bacterium]
MSTANDSAKKMRSGQVAGKLGIIALPGCEEIAKKIDKYIVNWRSEALNSDENSLLFEGYYKDSYIIKTNLPRFGTGEAKAVINQSVRGYDIFILIDAFNYSETFSMHGIEVPMSPDDHFNNLKRVIAAMGGKPRRITVIMPMLYEGRQHKRTSRESLDCAMALSELCNLYNVDSILTVDAHDARVQNAIPLKGFENVSPVYQMIKSFVKNVDNIHLDKEHTLIVSPDEGGMSRCIYYATVLGLDVGMFYKRRDYSTIVNGRNPIISHEFLGDDVKGMDVMVVDDMISSGDSMIEVATRLKEKGAKRIFIFSSFGIFCEGLNSFDKAYDAGLITKVFTTNLIYRSPELKARPWYVEVDMSKYIAYFIDNINNEHSLATLLNPVDRINSFLKKNGLKD